MVDCLSASTTVPPTESEINTCIPEMSKTPPMTCRCIQGKLVEEYILTTQTRSLGGISMDLRGQVKRDLFPYKPFTGMKEQMYGAAYLEVYRVKAAQDLQSMNDLVPEDKWTEDEKHIFDQTLRGFTRWEVDTGQRVVRATRCEGTTCNDNGICNPCKEILGDEAFKKAIYQVNVSHGALKHLLMVAIARKGLLQSCLQNCNTISRLLMQNTHLTT